MDGTFAIYEFAALETCVYLENRKDGIFVADGEVTRQYVESGEALGERALGEEESVELIDALAEGLIDG
ncbi:hypothetical protein EIL87_16470 [Saccharopolyspora rhizosphaerae]|uniref:DUF5753 domain-containing protein n=1 Tax=Saccharopolyspora rhizosphaerae TaxID=2492662 RepID=A0A426JR42_9PSEU|nr:hypothetical protein EIL87_16470 [Saccharopolyspora rhizosphaerae]